METGREKKNLAVEKQMSIKRDVKTALDEAIQAGKQPKAPRSGIGLVLPLNSRNRGLVNKNGVTKLGTYYYRQLGIDAPTTFDFQQDAVRRGRSKFIKLLDGTQKKVSTWDNIKMNGISLNSVSNFMQKQLIGMW